MTYFLRFIDNKNMVIELGNKVLTKLTYSSRFSSKAYIKFADYAYIFNGENNLDNQIKIHKNGIKIGTINGNRRGDVFLDIQEAFKKPMHLVMAYKGVFKPKKEVFLNGHHILTLNSKYTLTKSNYEVAFHVSTEKIPYPIEELLGILAYGAKVGNDCLVGYV